MEQRQNSDGLQSSFLESTRKSNKGYLRATAAKSYELIDILSCLYIKQGTIDNRVKISTLTAEHCLCMDIVDIFCYLNPHPSSPIRDAKLAIIEKIAVEFKTEALLHLAKLAFNKCWQQKEAIKLLLILPGGVSSARKKDLTALIANSFLKLNQTDKMLVVDDLKRLNYNEDYFSAIGDLANAANRPYQRN